MKPWIAIIVAVAALGFALNNPEDQAEGNAIVASISDTVDPYLSDHLSSDTHEELKAQSKEAADFVEGAGAELGVKLTFDPGK